MRKKERITKYIKYSILLLILLLLIIIGINYKKVLHYSQSEINKVLSNFYISFDKILSNDSVITEDKMEKQIKGIPLTNDDTFTYKDIVSYQEGVNQVFKIIGDKEYYYKNFSSLKKYYEGIKDKLSTSYYQEILDEKKEVYLLNIFQNIYEKENYYYSKTNIIGIGKTIDYTYLDIEIVAVADTTNFFIQDIRLILDKYDRIDNIQLLKEWTEVEYTTTPLSSESILYDSHKDFLKLWDKIVENLTNYNVYQEYTKGETSDVTYKINTLIEEVAIENKDYEILKQLFIDGKGTFLNYGCIEYYIEDIDMNALTTYQMKFSNNTYFIVYNRLTNKIENISLTKIETEN